MHTLKSFDEALDALVADFAEMGRRVNEITLNATRRYCRPDRQLALSVVDGDLEIDAMFERIRAGCFDTLVRFQPVARDLRLVMGIEHAVGDLERAGDHATNIAEEVLYMTRGVPPGATRTDHHFR